MNTINEVLEYVAGLDVRSVDRWMCSRILVFVVEPSISLLVNGIRMNNMQTGHHNMNYPFPSHD